MTASRTAELMSRLPGWFVEHARVTEEKARRRREALSRRYERLCGIEARDSRSVVWRDTIVDTTGTGQQRRPHQPVEAGAGVLIDSAGTRTPLPHAPDATNPASEWPEFMTPEELRDLTGRRSLASQADALRSDCIPHKVLRNRLLVSRFHVREWLADRLPAEAGARRHAGLVN